METLEQHNVPNSAITIAPGDDATEGGAAGSYIFTRIGDPSTAATVYITDSGAAHGNLFDSRSIGKAKQQGVVKHTSITLR